MPVLPEAVALTVSRALDIQRNGADRGSARPLLRSSRIPTAALLFVGSQYVVLREDCTSYEHPSQSELKVLSSH